MTIYIASDHAGFERKQMLKNYLVELGFEVKDLGPDTFDPQDDYPDFALPLAHQVANSPNDRGILLCGNGQGVCIAANKVQGIRAASAFSPEMAATTRADDNANILCLPGRFLDDETVKTIVKTWLETPFSGAKRHIRRLRKIEPLNHTSS